MDELAETTLEIGGSKKKICVDDARKIKIENDDILVEVTEIGIQDAGIDKLVEDMSFSLQTKTGGRAMPVLPPFCVKSDLNIPDRSNDQYFTDSDILKYYGQVRKNVARIMRIISNKSETRTYSDLVFQKSRVEALVQGLLSIGLTPDSVDRGKITFPTPWRQSSVDTHLILPQGNLNIGPKQFIVGLKIDEWTDFIPSTEEREGWHFNIPPPKPRLHKRFCLLFLLR